MQILSLEASIILLAVTIAILGLLLLTWLKRKSKLFDNAMRIYVAATGIRSLLEISPENIPREEIKIEAPEIVEEEIEIPRLERIIRILFGYGGLLRHALELGEFSVRELAQSTGTQESIVNVWVRECMSMGILEEIEDTFTGEIKYRIRRDELDKISSDVILELSRLLRER